MSQYGGAPKPPAVWGARPAGMPNPGNLYAAANQQLLNMNAMGHPGMMNLSGIVNQAAFGGPQVSTAMGLVGMNPLAVAQAQQAPQARAPQPTQQMPAQVQPVAANKSQRTFIGRVTKMHDTYGFVDEDVFFQSNVVRGPMPRSGDKVMVEANFNPSMPFKWNAYRIQVMNDGAPQQQPPAPAFAQQPAFPARRETPTGPRQSQRSPPPPRRSSPVKRREPSPRREPREDRKRERERSPPPTRTGSVVPSSRRDSASPPRRRQRIIPRYVCNLPKPTPVGNTTAIYLKKRYTQIYVPSDFCDFRVDWTAVSASNFLDFTYPIQFHVLQKEVDPLEELPPLEPDDADHRYQVKVLLLAHAGRTAINQKAYGLAKDGALDDTYDPQDLFKGISFLTGIRNKENVPLGGSYSPSLDGPDPLSLGTMIKTAVRCVKALTGLDLSNSAQWFQLGQLRYFRTEKDRLDRITLLLPTSAELQPTDEQFAAQSDALRQQLAGRLAALEAPSIAEPIKTSEPAAATTTAPNQESLETTTPSKDVEMEDEGEDPTHWSKLDIKTMKVVELRSELAARGLDSKGIKTLLVQRLEEALDKEKEADGGEPPAEEQPAVEKPEENTEEASKVTEERKEGIKPAEETETQKKAREEEEKKKKEQAEKERAEKKASLEKKFSYPAEPKAFVWPHREFKGGKFDCKVVPLKALLDYRPEDNKEHQFEASLFAESIKELFERHYGQVIGDAIVRANDREEEHKRRQEAYKPDPAEDKEKADADVVVVEDSKKEEKKLDLKPRIQNVKLFEAFAFYDPNLLGYLQESDLEEILSATQPGYNRSVVKKIASKLSRHDKVNYRALTDQLLDKDGNVRFVPGQLDESPLVTLINAFEGHIKDEEASTQTNGTSSDSGVVVIDGCVVNVEQKLAEMKKLDAEKQTALQKLAQAESTNKTLKETRDHLEKRKKRLEEDVERYRRKKDEAEKHLKSATDDSAGVRTALVDAKKFAEKLLDALNKGMPEEKKKEEKKEEKPVLNGASDVTQELDDDEIVLADSVGDEKMDTAAIEAKTEEEDISLEEISAATENGSAETVA
ncbi:unnamed protein product, partial [Mesorhabditis spiculigera]